MSLDYSPLNEQNPQPIKSDKTDIPEFNNAVGALFFTALIVLLTCFLILPVLLAPLIYIKVKKHIDKSGNSSIKLSNFAVKNGFRYRWGFNRSTGELQKMKYIGVIGSYEKQIVASNFVNGTCKDMDFELFCPFSRGLYIIMRVKLHNKYPHMVLDSRANNPLISNIGHFFGEDSRIHLEGDFGKYFKVYAKAPAVDTLRILSPDMMSRMVDAGYKCDIEIVEDNLHIISNFKYVNEDSVRYFFELADTLLDKLDRRSATKDATFDHTSRVV